MNKILLIMSIPLFLSACCSHPDVTGQYYAIHKKGVEKLMIYNSGSYIHSVMSPDNVFFSDTGQWNISENDGQIKFHQWYDRLMIYPGSIHHDSMRIKSFVIGCSGFSWGEGYEEYEFIKEQKLFRMIN